MLFENTVTWKTHEDVSLSHMCDEEACLLRLQSQLPTNVDFYQRVRARAEQMVRQLREFEGSQTGLVTFMQHYNLSTEEGVILMSLAESLLRIPDSQTRSQLLKEKLTSADWRSHLEEVESAWVKLGTRALVLSKGVLKQEGGSLFSRSLASVIKRLGEPVIRTAVFQAIELMSQHYVLGSTIEESMNKAEKNTDNGIGYSYDMLGEEVKTKQDSDRYYQKYQAAIQAVGRAVGLEKSGSAVQGVSVKLSALHPRYEAKQIERCLPILVDRLTSLALQAQAFGISLTVDAEEADRLDISLSIFEQVLSNPNIKSTWSGFGLAVQAYSKRALPVLEWLVGCAKSLEKRIEVRLVKGAYWDTEIKRAQMNGDTDYPLFTRKESTDYCYLACVEFMLKNTDWIQPIFATHNAFTLSFILERYQAIGGIKPIFQVLQGMGDGVVSILSQESCGQTFTRMIYAPVGAYADLLPYLVRRLLENGVNSSFVNQLTDHSISMDELLKSPVESVNNQLKCGYVSPLPAPLDIFGSHRSNSVGINLSNPVEFEALQQALKDWDDHTWHAHYLGSRPPSKESEDKKAVVCPFDNQRIVGYVTLTGDSLCERSISDAHDAFQEWSRRPVDERALCLENLADLIIKHRSELLYLLIHEAGKVIEDAVAELREAEDFCRYYAAMARETLQSDDLLGYTGETNQLRYVGRGVILCISPWNFPAAIFLGQVVASLVAGNTVIAKPAGNTCLIAYRLTQLAHESGIPAACLHLLCASGSQTGRICVPNELVQGVVFTGSTAVAKGIQRGLAERAGAIVPLIAETGGLNAMIADSSALTEQLVTDVMDSAFGSSGQRCSALRLLCLPEETADTVLEMLKGAMEEWVIGNPRYFRTDAGPVIDQSSADEIHAYLDALPDDVKWVATAPDRLESETGSFVRPVCYELKQVSDLKEEVFGPVLHVVRYNSSDLPDTVHAINQLGYGLTFGVHSRLSTRIDNIVNSIEIGNIYINRNITGAVVGVNPFGGQGLSGTGPKAGGPNYVRRLCHEITVTNNTTALGGNIELMQSLLEQS